MRERLIAAAVGCFASKGYAVTTVADITSLAGTSHGNFYRYFDNVQDALRAAVEGPLEELYAGGRRPTRADAASLDALVAWQRGFLHAYAPHRTLFTVMREAAAGDRGMGFADTWQQLRGRFVDEVEAWVRDVEAELGPDPDGLSPRQHAEVLAAMGEQTAHVHVGLAHHDPTDERIESIARAIALTNHRAVVAPRLR